jgi:hypothetical protein
VSIGLEWAGAQAVSADGVEVVDKSEHDRRGHCFTAQLGLR